MQSFFFEKLMQRLLISFPTSDPRKYSGEYPRLSRGRLEFNSPQGILFLMLLRLPSSSLVPFLRLFLSMCSRHIYLYFIICNDIWVSWRKVLTFALTGLDFLKNTFIAIFFLCKADAKTFVFCSKTRSSVV